MASTRRRTCRRRPRRRRWAAFLGYTLLGDTSIHFALIDWVMKHGFHAAPNMPPSSTQAALGSVPRLHPPRRHLHPLRPDRLGDEAWLPRGAEHAAVVH